MDMMKTKLKTQQSAMMFAKSLKKSQNYRNLDFDLTRKMPI